MRPILTLRHYTDLIVHSHEHAQLVFGLSGALDFESRAGSQVRQQSFVVVPGGAHHACGSPDGSRCLVLDVPGGPWVNESLGEHADASRACSTSLRVVRWMGKANWSPGWPTARSGSADRPARARCCCWPA
jgi:hypothetical protein